MWSVRGFDSPTFAKHHSADAMAVVTVLQWEHYTRIAVTSPHSPIPVRIPRGAAWKQDQLVNKHLHAPSDSEGRPHSLIRPSARVFQCHLSSRAVFRFPIKDLRNMLTQV